MSEKQKNTAIKLAGLVRKLCAGSGYDDWQQQQHMVMQTTNLDHMLDPANIIAVPKFAKPVIADLELRIRGLRGQERIDVIEEAKEQALAWKKYEVNRRLSIFTFLLISSTIETTCEAYADVRNTKNQNPAALWKALSDRYQPACASHHVNLMVEILQATVGEKGISGLIDEINATKLRILAASGSIGDDVLKLALIKAVRQEDSFRGLLYPTLCQKFDASYDDLSKTALEYARNVGNLDKESDETGGPRVLSAKLNKKNRPKWDRATGGQRACFKCGDPDHVFRDCPKNQQKCKICKKRGHKSENCWQAESKKRGYDDDAESSTESEDEEGYRPKKKPKSFLNKRQKLRLPLRQRSFSF